MADLAAEIAKLEQDFLGGDRRALAMALVHVVVNKAECPPWVRIAYAQGYGRVKDGHLPSWDDVFGRFHKNERERHTSSRHAKLKYPIWHRVRSLNAGDGPGIAEELYRSVGAEFGIGWRLVRRLYSRMQNNGGRRANIFRPHRRARNRKA